LKTQTPFVAHRGSMLAFRAAAVAALLLASACAVPAGGGALREGAFVAPRVEAPQAAAAGSHEEELAMKLQNPVADLISVPFQLNYDGNVGPADGEKTQLNIQPVIPMSLNEDWNVISRTILPIIYQNDIAGESGSQSGLGDTLQSFFFSPKYSETGIIWGVGPIFEIPTGNDELLGDEKWSAGPTFVALQQDGPWTFGALGWWMWSYAGDSDRNNVNRSFVQPFLSYTTPEAVSYTLNSESLYDWELHHWSMPINGVVTKVTRLGDQLVSFGAGLRYWITSPDGGPDGWGVRFVFTLLYPEA